MKTEIKPAGNRVKTSPASIHPGKRAETAGLVDKRSTAALQRQLIDAVDNSPRVVSLRQDRIKPIMQMADTLQRYRAATVKGVWFGQRRVYGADGHYVGNLPKNTRIEVSDNTVRRTLTKANGKRKTRQCYVITSNPQLSIPVVGGDTSVMYISGGGVKRVQQPAADPLAGQQEQELEQPVQALEEDLACWNWALYALDDAVTVYELDKVFLLLERQVAFQRGGNEWLPHFDQEQDAVDSIVDNYRTMCNNRVINGEIDQERADQMVQEYENRVEAVRDEVGRIRDRINNEDLTQMSRQEITRKYNYYLTEVILRDAGFRVLPPDTTGTWKVGQHVEQGTYGWEHWWLRTPGGNYIDHFPGQGNGIRKANILPFGYGDDDIIEVPVADIKPEHKQKSGIEE